jgi:hypothetical protein
MFDKKIEIPWRRSNAGNGPANWNWPTPGQICLIYFFYTGFSISEYDESDYLGDGKKYTDHVFSDYEGFLGDDDVLWIPLNELPPVGSFKSILIPDSYLKDPKFAKDK